MSLGVWLISEQVDIQIHQVQSKEYARTNLITERGSKKMESLRQRSPQPLDQGTPENEYMSIEKRIHPLRTRPSDSDIHHTSKCSK